MLRNIPWLTGSSAAWLTASHHLISPLGLSSTIGTLTVFPGSLPHWPDSSPAAETLSNLSNCLEHLSQCLAHRCSMKACYTEMRVRARGWLMQEPRAKWWNCMGTQSWLILQDLPGGDYLALEVHEPIIFRLGYLHKNGFSGLKSLLKNLSLSFVGLCR